MTGRERIARTAHHELPDRVPVMCQLSLGHYFLNVKPSGDLPACLEIWYTSEGFARALVELQRRYHFDGILINLVGRDDQNWEKEIERIEYRDSECVVHWKNGWWSEAPFDDNPHEFQPGGRQFPTLSEVDPELLFYDDPHGPGGLKYPFYFGLEPYKADKSSWFPRYATRTIERVKELTRGEISIHGEIFSPWTQFMELLGYENALVAILEDPGKVKAICEAYSYGAAEWARIQARAGCDAILMSSAFAGGGFISPDDYAELVLPAERRVWEQFKKEFPDVPCYTHTCGAIGDRLELMRDTLTNGIDTLDPPPLGTCELEDAKARVGRDMFLKGNMDSVSTLLRGTPDMVRQDATRRVLIGKPGGGYILSTACSVAPPVKPEHIEILYEVVEEHGRY
jgi:uroporphyrinogen-III decarboxylase